MRWGKSLTSTVSIQKEGILIKKNIELSFKDYKVTIEKKLNLKKLYIEVTNRCNLNCKMCFRRFWKDPIGEINIKNFKHILESTKPFKELETIYLGGIGEPTVHPKFSQIIQTVKDYGYRLEFATNGTTLKKYANEIVDTEVDTIIISIDSPDPLIYKDIRGTEFFSIIENVKTVQEIKERKGKRTPAIGVEVVVMKENLNSLEEIVKLAGKELKANFIMFSNLMPFSKELSEEIVYNGLVDTKSIIDRLNKLIGTYRIKVLTPKFELLTERRCQFVEESTAVVRWDGEVAPCYRFLHNYPEYILGRKKQVKAFSFGNALKERLSDIWTKQSYVAFRYSVKNFLFPSCTDCPLRDACEYVKDTDADCWGNIPSCGDCLWARDIVKCP